MKKNNVTSLLGVVVLFLAACGNTTPSPAMPEIDSTKPTDITSLNVGKMIGVPGGYFHRDSVDSNISCISPFHIGQFEVSRAQFQALMVESLRVV